MKYSLFTLSTLAALATADTAVSAGRKAICGSTGYDKDTEGYYYGTEGTYAGCSAQCQNDPKSCKSFSFGDGACNLYAVAVKGNFDADSDSPYAFYDASCVSPASTTPSSTSTTTLKPSTTTTKSTTAMTSTAKSTTTTIIVTTTAKSTFVTSSKSSTITAKTTTQSITTTTSKTSVKPSTTTTKSTTTTTKSAAMSTTTSSSLAPPCPLPTFTVSNFKLINSAHNCDCAGAGPDIGDGTGCLGPNGNWCDPRYDQECTHCGIGVCYTGLGTQPVGYGPPDSVSADISNIGSCFQQNPGTTPRRPIGDNNVVRCGGSQNNWQFSGDSTIAKSVAYFTLQNTIYCGDGGYYRAYGSGQAAMSCSFDSQKNATCVLDNPSFEVPATIFGNAYYSDGSNNN